MESINKPSSTAKSKKKKSVQACSYCTQTFTTKKRLQNHFTRHHQFPLTMVHNCVHCFKVYKSASSLQQHERSIHKIEPQYTCKTCLKVFNSLKLFRQHIKVEHRRHLDCKECSKTFLCKAYLNKHMALHNQKITPKTMKYECNVCTRKFQHESILKKHLDSHHRKIPRKTKKYECNVCARIFQYQCRLEKHLISHDKETAKKTASKKTTVTCHNCSKVFSSRILLNRHLKMHCISSPIDDVSPKMIEIMIHFDISFTTALRGSMNKYIFTPKKVIANEKQCFDYLEKDIIAMLKSYNEAGVLLKWSYCLNVEFTRLDADGEPEFKKAGFSSEDFAYSNMDINNIEEQYTSMRNAVVSRIDKYSKEGSGWVLCNIISFNLSLYRYKLTGGGKSVTLPSKILYKRCVINIDCDNCFKWAVLSALHHQETEHPNRITSYTQWEQDYVFPLEPIITASHVSDFVKKNNLPIFAHLYTTSKSKSKDDESEDSIDEEKLGVECMYRPPKHLLSEHSQRVHLLLYDGHWLAITKLSALYRRCNLSGSFNMCITCLATFYGNDRYEKHLPCKPGRYIQTEIMPTEDLEFKEFQKCVDLSDIIYADMESILVKCDYETNAHLLQKHIPCCVGSYWVSKVQQSGDGKYKEFKGSHCIVEFVNKIDELVKHIYERNKTQTRVPAAKTSEEILQHENATHCIWCKRMFEEESKSGFKVFDHDHLTGKYRGPACQRCNSKLIQQRSQLVVAFHNFRGYDSHGLCLQGFSAKPGWILKPLAQTCEKYISLTASVKLEDGPLKCKWFSVKFVDTLQLLNSSLATLATNLIRDDGKDFSLLKHSMKMKLQYPTLRETDIAGKGTFPYSYVSSWEKLDEHQLPPYEAFYDELEEMNVTTLEDYEKAQQMFRAFGCKTLFDYQLRYMELDCRLLADVFEEFRRLTKEEDGLDAAHFITVSQLSYASALKKCDTKIELIKIPEMYRAIEKCKRGGYAFVNKHYCKASNPYVNPGTEHTPFDVYLGDVDANNLYGNALRYPLPVGGWQYLDEENYKSIDWRNIPLDGSVGYFVTCDLHYPKEIQDRTSNLPLAMEVLEITEDMLPDYFKGVHAAKNLARNPDVTNPERFTGCTKLMATCYDKKEYVVHFTALQLYLQYGLIITKIHNVIQFDQKPVFRDYIDYNSGRRQDAKNEFEKDFYKQKNNSLFGKSLENMRNRHEFSLCNSPKSLNKAASQHRFIKAIEFNENLVAVQLTKANVQLCAPIGIGAAILDISKTIMYKIVYDEFARYERIFNCELNIVGGDTDSLFFEAVGVDLIGTLYPKMMEDGLLDTSNYDKQHPFFSDKYKARLGCIKDEFSGKACKEFILLRPKSYSMITVDNPKLDKKKSKGVPKRKVKLFTHEDFQNVFFDQTELSTNYRRMQSIGHVVYNVEHRKIALSYADDKRAWYSNNYSLPYGHRADKFHKAHPPPNICRVGESPIKRAKML